MELANHHQNGLYHCGQTNTGLIISMSEAKMAEPSFPIWVGITGVPNLSNQVIRAAFV